MVSHLDRDVGRILDKLAELGLDENTVVLFTSDNGPHDEGGADPGFFESNGPLRGLKRDLYEGGIRVPMIAWGPGLVPAGQTSDHVWAMWDVLPTVTDLAQVEAPDSIDGLSMANVLRGEGAQLQHPYLYWEFNNTSWGGHYAKPSGRATGSCSASASQTATSGRTLPTSAAMPASTTTWPSITPTSLNASPR